MVRKADVRGLWWRTRRPTQGRVGNRGRKRLAGETAKRRIVVVWPQRATGKNPVAGEKRALTRPLDKKELPPKTRILGTDQDDGSRGTRRTRGAQLARPDHRENVVRMAVEAPREATQRLQLAQVHAIA